VARTDSDQIQLFTEMDKPYGLTYGEWTVIWWQWVLSVPTSINPLTDQTGQHWNTAQPSSDVYFLVGNIGAIHKSFPHRNIKIESGRSILLPVLNCEANSLEYPDLKTHDDLLRHVVDDVNTIVKKNVFINGIRLNPVRVPSEPRIFRVTINKDNIFGVKDPNSTDATADGFWIFLKPLPRGSYTIRIEGSCEFGRLNSGAVYEIEIV
jgi:hypothetical protein